MEKTKKVSCSIIYFLMFAKSKFCNFSRCFCYSPGSERLAGEDGCTSGYCCGASESFVSKIYVFWIWCSVGLCPEAVPSRYTTGLQGISEGPRFLLENPQSQNLTYHPWSFFFCPASKKPIAFNYSTFWSSLIICSSLTNARDSLEFNIHIGKLRMPVTCFWIYWLKWDTIVL